MRAIRTLAIAILVLLAVYYALRATASACSGTACDIYIPISLLLPLLILVTAAITGITATMHARGAGGWPGFLFTVTAIGFLGPFVSLLVFRNSPDHFVPVSSALEVLVAIAALGYSFLGRRSSRRPA